MSVKLVGKSASSMEYEQPEYHTECRYPDCQCKRVVDAKADFGFRLICEAPPLPPARSRLEPVEAPKVSDEEPKQQAAPLAPLTPVDGHLYLKSLKVIEDFTKTEAFSKLSAVSRAELLLAIAEKKQQAAQGLGYAKMLKGAAEAANAAANALTNNLSQINNGKGGSLQDYADKISSHAQKVNDAKNEVRQAMGVDPFRVDPKLVMKIDQSNESITFGDDKERYKLSSLTTPLDKATDNLKQLDQELGVGKRVYVSDPETVSSAMDKMIALCKELKMQPTFVCDSTGISMTARYEVSNV
jgi:hypothetical protein